MKLKTREAVTLTVKLPRRAWPEELKPPAPRSCTAVGLLRGRLTSRHAVMVIRVEGSFREIQKALDYWECRGFTVEEGDRQGTQEPRRDPGNRIQPDPSLHGRGGPFRGSRGHLP